MNKSKLLLTTFVAATLSFGSAYASATNSSELKCTINDPKFGIVWETTTKTEDQCTQIQSCYSREATPAPVTKLVRENIAEMCKSNIVPNNNAKNLLQQNKDSNNWYLDSITSDLFKDTDS